MSILPVVIGEFAAVYADLASNGTPMPLLSEMRTNTVSVEITDPTRYIVSQDQDYQSDLYTVKFTLSFISTDENVWNLAKGQPLGTDSNSPFAYNKFSVLLLSLDTLGKSSFYFPSLRTVKSVTPPYSKTDPTIITVSFIAANRDISTNLYYKNTATALAATMGGKSPL